MPGMQAAFVDIGLDRAGFLGAREAAARRSSRLRRRARSQDRRLRARRRSHRRAGGQGSHRRKRRAAFRQCHHCPAGLLVMTPNQPGIALSRRIETKAERAALIGAGRSDAGDGPADCPGAGFIFRTAAQGACLEDLAKQDAAAPWRKAGGTSEWQAQNARGRPLRSITTSVPSSAPCAMSVRRGDVVRVLIDDAGRGSGNRAPIAVAPCRARKPDRIVRDQPVFVRLYGLEDEIAGLAMPRVTLPSGAWITIEATEALTAIDVNSGRFTAAAGTGRNQPVGQSGSGGRDRPPDSLARHWRADRGGLYSSERAGAWGPRWWRRWTKSLGVRPRPGADFADVANSALSRSRRKRVREPLSRILPAWSVAPVQRVGRGALQPGERGAGRASTGWSAKPAPRRGRRSWPRRRRRSGGMAERAPGRDLRNALARRGAGRVIVRGRRFRARSGSMSEPSKEHPPCQASSACKICGK
jgi:hypothetical protein